MIPEVKYMIHKLGLPRNLKDYLIYKWLKKPLKDTTVTQHSKPSQKGRPSIPTMRSQGDIETHQKTMLAAWVAQ